MPSLVLTPGCMYTKNMSSLPPIHSLFAGPHKPVVVFDVDDTLAPTGAALGHELWLWVSHTANISYDDARKGCIETFHRHGHRFAPLKERFGLCDEHEQHIWNDVTNNFHRDIHRHIRPDPQLIAWMHRLASRSALMAAFTANDRYHGEKVIPTAGLGVIFDTRHIYGRACVNYHSKTSPDAYRELNDRYLAHIPPEHPRIMVEDLANNLPGARAMGWHTVHVGQGPVRRAHRYAIDYTFPTTLHAVRTMCGPR